MIHRFTLLTLLVLIGLSPVRAQHYLWGMTSSGVADNKGVIFKTNQDGSGYGVQYNFITDFPGASPYNALTLAANGKLYGMAYAGGVNDKGIIFEYDPVNDTYLKKFDFSTSDGTYPQGGLVQASNGLLYGMTTYGGATNEGVLFEFDPVGNSYTKKVDFSSAGATGFWPQGNLIQAANGQLYGMTPYGGANNVGVLFEYNPGTSTYLKKVDFSTSATGSLPTGDLVQAGNGKLYGLTSAGGTNGKGVLFEYLPGGTSVTKQKDLSSATGANPSGSLALALNGKLYGLTSYGGTSDKGVLFDYDVSSNTLTKKIDFDVANGANPQGAVVQAGNGKLYGMAINGGLSNEGVIFEYDIGGNTLTKKFDFSSASSGGNPLSNLVIGSNGKLYGMTPFGGPVGFGVLFEYDQSSSTYAKKVDFSNSSDGSNPKGSLTEAPNGMLYGLASSGGSNSQGVLFEYDPIGLSYIKKVDFSSSTSGANPAGSLVLAGNGKLYGLTPSGGANGDGVLFEYDPGASSVVTKIDFSSSTNGASPQGSLILAANGKLYGLTSSGGTNGNGVLFEYDPSSGGLVNQFNFTTSSGGTNPNGSLVQAANGKLYGMTNQGGASGSGVIFQYDATTSTYTKKVDFTNTNGSFPYGDLVQASNGKLYGMTSGGGANSDGVIFEFDPATGMAIVKYDFISATSGASPRGSLVEAATGKLMGMNFMGGTQNSGVLFQYDISGPTFSKLFDFGGANGASPSGSLLVVPGKQNQTITFNALPSKMYGDAPFLLTATASSGLAVTYTSSDPLIASISGSTVTINNFGTVTITASQGGDIDYNFAPDVNQSLVINRASQTITFGPLPAKTFGDAPFVLSATASSGLPVSFISGDATIASITVSTVTILKAGTVTITASQAGDTFYNPAPDVPQSLVINKANQSIAFVPPGTVTFGTGPFSFSAAATSGLTVAFSGSGTGAVSITGSSYTIVQAGSVTVTASQAGNANYNAAPDNQKVLTINKADQTITFGPIPSKVFGDPPFALSGFASSGLTLTYASSDPTVASISGTTVTILKAGSSQITATQSGDVNYNAAPGVPFQVLTVNKANQTITFSAIPNKTVASPPFTLSASASSGLTVSYVSSDPSVATVSGNTVTIIGLGTTTITGSQPGDVNYNAATPVNQPLTVSKVNQTITFSAIPVKSIASPAFILSASASSGLTVSYISTNPSVATVSGNTVTIVGLGTTTITASQAGNIIYNAAPSVDQSLTVIPKQSQTITFGSLSAKNVSDPPFTLTATASSGLPVSYVSSVPSVASVSGNTVTLVGPGSTTITASQAGDVNYDAAVPVNQLLTVNKTNQTITFSAIPFKSIASPPFTLSASASSGLTVNFVSSDPFVATVSGNTVTIVGIGTTTITASQAGNANYNAAPSVDQSLSVFPKQPQVITFGSLPAKKPGDPPFSLNATASSGLPVSYVSSNSSVAAITGNTVTIIGLGNSIITASQSGDEFFNPANSVNQVQAVIVTGDLPDLSVRPALYPNPATDKLFVDLNDFLPSPVDLRILDLTGRSIHQQSATGGSLVEISVADHTAGMYILIVTQGERTLEIKYFKN